MFTKKHLLPMLITASFCLCACGSSDTTSSSTSAMSTTTEQAITYTAAAPTSEVTKTDTEVVASTEPLSATCEESHPGESSIVLTSMTVVDGAAGHPAGSKTVTWSYTGDTTGKQVTFGVSSKQATRVVKFQKNQMIANSYMKFGADAQNVNISVPVSFTPNEQQAVIPAAIGPTYNQSWSGDLSIDGVRVGSCST